MIPRILCTSCGNELVPSDKFCGKCGTKVEWQASTPENISSQEPTVITPVKTSPAVCPQCGQRNPDDASFCESCGSRLAQSSKSKVAANPKRQDKSAKPGNTSKSQPLKALQSWKVTAGFALALIATLIILKSSRDSEPEQKQAQMGQSPHSPEMIKQIEAVQKQVDANPKDLQATLQLANMLHDVKFLPRAVTMYQRYLEMNPSNPDARVDLGITYFELSIGDSLHRDEFNALAKHEMERALTYAPKHQLAHFNLGIVNLHGGDIETANEWFKKCIKLDPNSETGKRAQQLISQHSFNNPS